ncbi:1-phosphatidylinositol 4,5-bisphosphate phosphodiesterase zeta-1-like [Brachionichthys hirsutus]|uniref:1-phosphatidylinositol 4,5-bisphosphate phosphodiesterase zeta-1-like n=1 Tax=Brachionichthys hirsutus TaxID=412623 RepID=UPI00360518FD
MRTSRAPATRRAEIQNLYQCCASGQTTLPASKLLKFLHNEQTEFSADKETAESLIDKYEIEETARENRSMTFEGFFRYMESKDNCVFNQAHTFVYQDMGQPLSNYFISSSHNTYLMGNQLVGRSHTDAYVRALRKGCRCLEIDCWDGPNMEPVVYHGYTLTNKILFRDVITTVEQHAFEVSSYPVILSLENHCSWKQQEVMAQYLISILGDKLLRAPLDRSTTRELPSPNELKHKILIKNKKANDKSKEEESVDKGKDEDEDDADDEDKEDNGAEEENKGIILPPRKAGPKKKALSDLVIYTRSVKFISFSHSACNQNPYENTSMPDKEARKLVNTSGADFVRHNQRFLSRIYPTGISSNLNPQEFWNIGAQLVALNFQTPDFPMALNDGRFQDNGACGYVLKPAVLLSSQRRFDPSRRQSVFRSTTLLLKIISGSNLPSTEIGKALSPLVRVDIHGIPSDCCRKFTRTVNNNSLSPRWDTEMRFTIRVPELCLVRFCVRDCVLFRNTFVGQYTLPLASLKKGYRWVPLLSRDGCSLDPASLFVFVSVS